MSWLEAVSWISIVLGFVTAGIMCIDLVQHPQKMRIMNIVWPVTGLYFPLIGLWFYKSVGRPMAADAPAMKGKWPYWKLIFLSATHCGSGCVIGDILGPPIVFGFGLTLLGSIHFAEYVVGFAYAVGIAFQYFPIRWMRNIPPHAAILDAVKADTLSLVAFRGGNVRLDGDRTPHAASLAPETR